MGNSRMPSDAVLMRQEKNGPGDGANRRGTRGTSLQVGVGLLARLEQRETSTPKEVYSSNQFRFWCVREHFMSAKNKPHVAQQLREWGHRDLEQLRPS